MIICCIVLIAFGACTREPIEIVPPKAEGNIVLKVSANNRPISKAPVEDNYLEAKIERLDVFIFDSKNSNDKVYYESFVTPDPTDEKGTIVLAADRKTFTVGRPYYVYLIANSNAKTVEKFSSVGNLNELKMVYQEDPAIFLTGLPSDKNTNPTSFLMDGAAYVKTTENNAEPTSPQPVVLYDGNDDVDTELTVALRRAAAKIFVNIDKGDNVTQFNATAKLVYFIKNMPIQSSLLAEVNAPAKLINSAQTNGGYLKYASANDNIQLTTYMYSHDWSKSDIFEEVRVVMNIPMTFNIPDTENNTSTTTLENNWYQIPISKSKILKRNNYYEISVTINTIGAQSADNAIVLDDIQYETHSWTSVGIEVGTDDASRPKYLTVNRDTLRMYNVAQDLTSLEFASSSDIVDINAATEDVIDVEVVNYYFIDKFGQRIARYDANGNSISAHEAYFPAGEVIGEESRTVTIDKTMTGEYTFSDWYDYNWDSRQFDKDSWLIEQGVPEDELSAAKTALNNNQSYSFTKTVPVYKDAISASADKGLNGGIQVYSPIPTNNTVRYIELRITNSQGLSKMVIVEQYPLEYIVHVEGYYSYRSDFGGTSYQEKGTQKTNNGFFYSRVYRPDLSTSNPVRRYTWGTNNSEAQTNNTDAKQNHRMYHVRITASSGKYTIGRPRMTAQGITDPNADNQELVSPSFMIASQLGVTYSGYTLREYGPEHCKNYVETYKETYLENGVEKERVIHLHDWRLPTEAEVEIIMKFQYTENAAMDEVLAGQYYYCASGKSVENTYEQRTGSEGTFLRCIRDAFETPVQTGFPY